MRYAMQGLGICLGVLFGLSIGTGLGIALRVPEGIPVLAVLLFPLSYFVTRFLVQFAFLRSTMSWLYPYDSWTGDLRMGQGGLSQHVDR